jgi:hypothetical protein
MLILIDEFHLMVSDPTPPRTSTTIAGPSCRDHPGMREAGEAEDTRRRENGPAHLARPPSNRSDTVSMPCGTTISPQRHGRFTAAARPYTDYRGTPQEFVSAVKRGFLYQGQRYAWQENPRGMVTAGVRPAAFVLYTQNHDQVANSLWGLRAHALGSAGRHRALTALLLLAPGTPMLFQGQEFAASSPFLFFSDLTPELAPIVYQGRREFLQQFPSLSEPTTQACIPDPADPTTFERSKLDLSERETHREAYALHRDLLTLRRQDPAFRAQRMGGVDGAVLGAEMFALRFFGAASDDRLLLVNLGGDCLLEPMPEPLLAPPEGRCWSPWSTVAFVWWGWASGLAPDQAWTIQARPRSSFTWSRSRPGRRATSSAGSTGARSSWSLAAARRTVSGW